MFEILFARCVGNGYSLYCHLNEQKPSINTSRSHFQKEVMHHFLDHLPTQQGILARSIGGSDTTEHTLIALPRVGSKDAGCGCPVQSHAPRIRARGVQFGAVFDEK